MKLFKSNIERMQLLLPLMVWLLIFTLPLLLGDFENGVNWLHISKIWKEYLILFLIFLTNRFFLMPEFFFKNKRTEYFIAIVILIAAFGFLLYWLEANEAPEKMMDLPPHGHGRPLGTANEPQGPPPRMNRGPIELIPPYVNITIMSILMIGFDSGLMFFSKWMKSQQNQLKAEKESVENKMAFLQNQVSPHFFMNTLNNIHALIDIDQEEAKESVIKLSQMMDYMLYESQSSDISLKQEVEFINSYVDLMKLRYTDDVDIKINVSSALPAVKIPPLLTISFIENAFKYGISYEKPSFIHINIDVSKTDFNFLIRNSINSIPEKKKNSGIGISNAKNRLDLLFSDKHQLIISNKNAIFEVKLNFPL